MSNNIMLDLETMDNVGTSSIIAIGAVKFDHEVTDRFYEIVDLQSSLDAGLSISADTILWWMKQNEAARKQLQRPGISLEKALASFSKWAGPNPIMWGNGAAFDNVILSNAYRSIGKAQPWKFWNDRCYRTVKAMNPAIPFKRIGTYHNAVDDADSQARHLIEILNKGI